MSILSIVLAVMLAASVAGNVFQAFFGLKIEQRQEQTTSTFTINENGNININNYGQSSYGDRVTWRIVTIQDVNFLTNFLMTLDNYAALNCRIVTMNKKPPVPRYILFYPQILQKVTTNTATLTNSHSNNLLIGIQKR